MRKLLFSLLFVFLLIGVADLILGQFNNINDQRIQRTKFLSETVNLEIHARHPVPGILHDYAIKAPDTNLPALEQLHRFRTDESGLLLPNDIKKKGPKIMFIGGSTTETHEVPEKSRFPYLVGKKLRERGLETGVINAGIRGHTLIDSINSLVNRKVYRDVDYVVIMHNINDRLFLSLKKNYFSDLKVHGDGSIFSILNSIKDVSNNIATLITNNSNIFYVLKQRFYNNRKNGYLDGSEIDFPDIDIEKSVKVFRQNLVLLSKLVEGLGAKPIFMTQPLGRYSEQQERFNNEIRNLASDMNIDLIDIAAQKKISTEESFYSDLIHLNEQGSIRVANFTSEFLYQYLTTKNKNNALLNNIKNGLSQINRCIDNGSSSKKPFELFEDARYASFSKNGRWIVMQEERGLEGKSKIRLVDLIQKKDFYLEHKLLNSTVRHPTIVSSNYSSVSVLFGQKNKSNFEELYVFEWPSKRVKKLSSNTLNGSIANVSGTNIFFSSSASPEQKPDIFKLDLITNRAEKLTNTPWEEWRPVSDRLDNLFFISDRDGNFNIFRLNLSTNKIFMEVDSEYDEWDPAVSPNNRYLVFASKREGSWDLFIKDLKTRKTKKFAGANSDEWDPAFHPSGKLIIFASFQNGKSMILGKCFDAKSVFD